MRKPFLLLIWVLCLFFRCGHLTAQGMNPPKLLEEYFKPVHIGQGELNFLFFSVYQIGLYAEKKTWSWQQRFALHVDYYRDISLDRLVDSTLSTIGTQKTLSAQEATHYRLILQRIYRPIQKRDTITAIFIPPDTMKLYTNAELTGDVADPAFVRDFFNIWLGPKTEYPSLRDHLLGKG